MAKLTPEKPKPKPAPAPIKKKPAPKKGASIRKQSPIKKGVK